MEAIDYIAISLTIFFVAGCISAVIIVEIDLRSIEFVQMTKTPCIDKNGNQFEDEMCRHKIECSKYGIVADYKCSEEGIRKLKGERT